MNCLFELRTLFILLLFLIAPFSSFAFPWETYLPAITNMGGQKCSEDNLVSCNTKYICTNKGLYWYNNVCNQTKHANQITAESLAGSWILEYSYLWLRKDHYWFDMSSVFSVDDDPNYSGYPLNTFAILGVNEQGYEVRAHCGNFDINYYPYTIRCTILDSPPPDPYNTSTVSKYFLFDFTSNASLEGTFRNIQDSNWENTWYHMFGYKLN